MHGPDAGSHGHSTTAQPDNADLSLCCGNPAGKVERRIGGGDSNENRQGDQPVVVGAGQDGITRVHGSAFRCRMESARSWITSVVRVAPTGRLSAENGQSCSSGADLEGESILTHL